MRFKSNCATKIASYLKNSVKIILMAFFSGLELPTCNQTNSFSLTKIVEQDPVFTDLL